MLRAKAAALQALPDGPPALTLADRYAAVATDVTTPEWYAKLHALGGHSPWSVPTVWLLEGLLYYLPEAAVDALLRKLFAASCAGSTLVASCVNCAAMKRAQSNGKSEAMQSFQSGIDAPIQYFADRGWTVTTAARPGDPECSFGRYPPPEHPADDVSLPATWYVVAIVNKSEAAAST